MGNNSIFNIDAMKGAMKDGLARPNKFLVSLPAGNTIGNDNKIFKGRESKVANDLPNKPNLTWLCRSCSLPINQMLTSERLIGMKQEKITYGYAQSDVILSFYEPNSWPIRKYFQTWQDTQVNQDTQELNFKYGTASQPGYAKDVRIFAMDTTGKATYGVLLIDAFPTTLNAQEFSNENNGIVDTTVTLAYTRYQTLAVGYAPTASKADLDFENGLDEFVEVQKKKAKGLANARLYRERNDATGLSTSTFI
jgi:hypothetical protein